MTFADDSNIVNLHNWSMGSFSGMSWENVRNHGALSAARRSCSCSLISKPIRAYQLGEVYAQNLGVPPQGASARRSSSCSSVLSACVTAFAGPISFVGIAVPHLMKTLFSVGGAPDHASGLLFWAAAAFCLACDLIAQDGLCPHGGQHQLCHRYIRRAHRHLHDDSQKGGVRMNDYLKTTGLSVGYDGKALIRDVALSVQRGKIVTLIGPNGSGKSTILKTVISQLPAIEGAVFLDGEDLRARSRRDTAKRMAIVMTARMDPELMTCRDVVSSGRYPYTGRLGILREEDKKIVEDSLRQVDALDFADKPFQAISDGQRQRILLARALCQQPELIVLDEPTSYLDIRYKLELLSILKRMVREKNLAVLMSLHELDLAARVSDTVVCVAGDRIDKVGAPEEIFTREYIAKLYHMEPGKYDACFDTLEFVP